MELQQEALRSLLQIIPSQPVTEEYIKESRDFLEYEIFRDVGKIPVNSDSKITFLLASLISASEIKRYFTYYAQALFDLAEASESLFYYKKASAKALKALRFLDFSNDEKKMYNIIQESRVKIKNLKKNPPMPINIQQEAREWNGNKELKAYWEGLSIPFRKSFMKISVQELKNYVNGDQQTLIEVLKTVQKRQKWKVWICRSCSQKFSSSEACHCHIEEEHLADFKPSDISWINQVWADSHSISVGLWKQVDVVACVQKINTRFEDVKAFEYKDGWCKDWTVTKESDRGSLLQEIRFLLLSLIKHRVISDSFREWIMHMVVKKLEKHDVSKEKIIDCHLEETPQSICFLERDEPITVQRKGGSIGLRHVAAWKFKAGFAE
ncbi:hypothetical protein V5N11_001180 [Cardamine amara subsp. amara]|uniref:C2H2-type domain-containing protein n=1 Tax=Cardamine amara subsp. amara TaxID=228776 RepID=A0ABD0ZU08_CARAN